jgi:hypothetical protein
MSGVQNTTAQVAVTGAPQGTSHFWSHRLLRLGIIFTVVISLLGLLFFFAPRYVVRYLVASELDALGIEYEGVKTININPWTGELWLGPMRFGAGQSDRGQLGELGLVIRFKPLLQRKVSAVRLLIRGIDVVVVRDSNGQLSLNGIPLHQFMPPPRRWQRSQKRRELSGTRVSIPLSCAIPG